MFEFNQPGQLVIIQPYEREAGVSLRDTNRPTTQSSAYGNTQRNLQDMGFMGGIFDWLKEMSYSSLFLSLRVIFIYLMYN